MAIKVFDYIEELDAFLVTEEFTALADYLGLTEWHPTVWIGRLFCMDNDFGEHWFDNWDARDGLAERTKAFGIDPDELMVIVPERFQDGSDGPCHPPEQRKAFWTEVLKSLQLSQDLLFAEARYNEPRYGKDDGAMNDLEQRIENVKAGRWLSQ